MNAGLKVLGDMVPQSIAAAGHAHTDWINASAAASTLGFIINTGALGGGSAALTFEQATSAAGAGAKALDAGAWGTVRAYAVDDTTTLVLLPTEDLDVDGGFDYVQATLTVTGGTGSLVAATVVAVDPKYLAS